MVRETSFTLRATEARGQMQEEVTHSDTSECVALLNVEVVGDDRCVGRAQAGVERERENEDRPAGPVGQGCGPGLRAGV